jgi:ferric-dicitrate binding protein FerR (iron transport regulator)
MKTQLDKSIIFNYLDGSASTEQKELVKSWLAEVENEALYFQYVAEWEKQHLIFEPEVSNAYQQFLGRIKKENQETKVINTSRRRKFVWQIAASIALVFGFSALLFFYQQGGVRDLSMIQLFEKQEVKWIEIVNETTETKEIVLADGSEVRLKPKSNLQYPPDFEAGKREVILKGEAFFDIRHQEGIPFFVQTAKLTIKVLGTSFNVKAYNKNALPEVAVKTGTVSVMTKSEKRNNLNHQIIITPNQRVTYIEEKDLLVRSLVEIPLPVAIEEKDSSYNEPFVFDNEPLDKVFELIEKVYQVDIILENQAINQCTLTAQLAEESLFVKLDLICKSIGASYEVHETQIVIRGNGCE